MKKGAIPEQLITGTPLCEPPSTLHSPCSPASDQETEKEYRKTIPFTIASKKNHLGINLRKEV
jgi:hypothetical protein